MDSPWQDGALARVDLADGSLSAVALPEWPREGTDLLVSQIWPLGDSLAVGFIDADVEVDWDFIQISVYDNIMAQYSGEWTERTRGLDLLVTGSVGDLLLGSVYSDAGRAVAAYDVAADTLHLSDEICLSGGHPSYPRLSAGATMFLPQDVGPLEMAGVRLTAAD